MVVSWEGGEGGGKMSGSERECGVQWHCVIKEEQT